MVSCLHTVVNLRWLSGKKTKDVRMESTAEMVTKRRRRKCVKIACKVIPGFGFMEPSKL